MALLVASRAAEFAKPWKSESSAALALPSVIQHSPVQKLFCMTNTALVVPLIRPGNVQYIYIVYRHSSSVMHVCTVDTVYMYYTFSPPVTFSVMSYNVLCDKYATRQQYGYCPSWALSWDYRKAIIMKELLDLTPDIIALQVTVLLQSIPA